MAQGTVRARQESATRVGGLCRVQRWVGLVGSSAAWARSFRGRCVTEVDGVVRVVYLQLRVLVVGPS